MLVMKRIITLIISLLFVSLISVSADASALMPDEDINLALIYHRLTEDENMRDSYTITVEDFENDIKYLLANDYTFCTASEFDEMIKKGDNTKKYVAVTFDDGYSSDYWLVLPVLEKYKVKATFYIVGSFLDKPYYMTQKQVATLSKSPYAEIGNHTYSIHSLSPSELNNMYTVRPDAAIEDYRKNSDFLEKLTGKGIKTVAYPYGVYGNYLNHILCSDGLITFSSKEQAASVSSSPYPRLNRPYDLDVESIINRHTKKLPDFYALNNIFRSTPSDDFNYIQN